MISLEDLQELAEQQFEAEQYVDACKESLRSAEADLRLLAEVAIPDAMDELEVTEIKTRSGLTLTVASKIHVGKLTAMKALNWLMANGEGGMIKSDVVVAFGKAEEAHAHQLCETLEAEGLQTKMDQHVHSSTIQSWLTKQLEAGAAVDLDLFGAYTRKASKVSLPKKK